MDVVGGVFGRGGHRHRLLDGGCRRGFHRLRRALKFGCRRGNGFDNSLHLVFEGADNIGEIADPDFHCVHRGVDGPACVTEGAGHAFFGDAAEVLVGGDIFQGGAGFANIGIGPVDQPVDGAQQPARVAFFGDVDDPGFEVAVGGGFTGCDRS